MNKPSLELSTDVPLSGVISEGDPEEQYHRLVSLGRSAISQAAFTLGDLALKVDTVWGEDRLAQYARDVGVPVKTLYNARAVAARWPAEKRDGISFGVADALAPQTDRFELVRVNPGMTVREAREIARERSSIAPAAPGADEPGVSVQMVRKLVQQQTRLVTLDHAEEVADILDRAASALRRRAKKATEGREAAG